MIWCGFLFTQSVCASQGCAKPEQYWMAKNQKLVWGPGCIQWVAFALCFSWPRTPRRKRSVFCFVLIHAFRRGGCVVICDQFSDVAWHGRSCNLHGKLLFSEYPRILGVFVIFFACLPSVLQLGKNWKLTILYWCQRFHFAFSAVTCLQSSPFLFLPGIRNVSVANGSGEGTSKCGERDIRFGEQPSRQTSRNWQHQSQSK